MNRVENDACADLNPLTRIMGELIFWCVTCVDSPFANEQKYMALCGGDRFVLDAARNDAEFPGLKRHGLIAKFNLQQSLEDQETLCGIRVRMPNKFTVELGQFELIFPELGDDFRRPLFTELF